MKVLIINSVCGIKSTGRIATDLADILSEAGHSVKIAYGREKVPFQCRKYSIRIGNGLDVRFHALKTRLFDTAGFESKRATLKFIHKIEEYEPDIIHLHNLHGYYINIEILFDFLKKYKKPVVWTLHDCWAFTGHCAHFSYVKCDRWKEICYNCPQKKEYPKSLVDGSRGNYVRKKELFNGVDKLVLVTPSKWLAKLVASSFLKGYDTRVINNGIDLNVFKPRQSDIRKKYNLEDKKIVLGVASSWSDRKGLYDFIRLREILGTDYVIILVGINKRQRRELENIKGMVLIERTDSTEELAEIYTAADVFVNLTYEDNYPTVNLEAQACGTPTLTYRTGGSVESVINGHVAEQGDIYAVRELIYKCEGERAVLRDFYDKNTTFTEYMNLYDELLRV